MPTSRDKQIEKVMAEVSKLLADAEQMGTQPKEILEAIQSVSKEIKKKAGDNPAISDLLDKVDAIGKQPPV